MDHDLIQAARPRRPADPRPTAASASSGRVILAFLSVFCLAGGLRAQAQEFRLIQGFEEIAERGKVPSYLVLAGSNRFSFLSPPGWNVSHDARERKVTLVSKDLGASISFSILPADTVAAPKPTVAELKEQLMVRYPDAKILRDFPMFSGGEVGQGFDLERSINPKARVSMRVAIVYFSGGRLEFNLTTASQQFPKYHRAFGNLLGSFQVGVPSLPSPPKK